MTLKIHPHTELKNKFDHLQKRALQLFEMGRKREHELKTAVVNAWNQFDQISAITDINIARERARSAKDFMREVLRKIEQ